MIRVVKSKEPPALTEKGYKCDEVKQTLLADQNEKCYLCERHVDLDFEVEHLISKHGDGEKINEWDNLFLACKYCNDRKKHYYDDIPRPNSDNWEDVIEMRMSPRADKIEFTVNSNEADVMHMVELLEKLHNGKDSMRNLMEERFWKLLRGAYMAFVRHLKNYLAKPTSDNKELVLSDLSLNAEFLCLKYTFVKSNQHLMDEFGEYMIWNRK